MKWCVVLAAAVAMALGVSSCTGSTTGDPAAAPSRPTSSAGSPTSQGKSASLPVNHACSLLSSDELAQLAPVAPPKQDMVGTAHECGLDTSDYSIGVAIRTDVGLAGVNITGPVTSIEIGTHQAKQVLNSQADSLCLIAIGVSQSSRVDVAIDSINGADPCSEALTVARLVEPKLP